MSESLFEKALTEFMCAEGEALMIENEVIDHVFSPSFEKKMDKLIKRRRKPYFRMINTVGKRVACIALAVFIATATTVMSVDALRNAVFDFFIKMFSTYSEIKTDDDSQHPDTIEDIYEITYDLSDFTNDFNNHQIDYRLTGYLKSDTNNQIDFCQFTKAAFDVHINTEGAIITHVNINGYDTLYYLNNQGMHNLIWDNGYYVFMISSNLSKDKTLDIANSVKKVETK